MKDKMAAMVWIFGICFASLISVSRAGDYCDDIYCSSGCCNYYGNECCAETSTSRTAAIIGACLSVGFVIVAIIVVIIVYRRRRSNVVVYRNQPAQAFVVQQGGQPGLANPHYPTQVQYAPHQAGLAQGPPQYDSHTFPSQLQAGAPANAGVVNHGYNQNQNQKY